MNRRKTIFFGEGEGERIKKRFSACRPRWHMSLLARTDGNMSDRSAFRHAKCTNFFEIRIREKAFTARTNKQANKKNNKKNNITFCENEHLGGGQIMLDLG